MVSLSECVTASRLNRLSRVLSENFKNEKWALSEAARLSLLALHWRTGGRSTSTQPAWVDHGSREQQARPVTSNLKSSLASDWPALSVRAAFTYIRKISLSRCVGSKLSEEEIDQFKLESKSISKCKAFTKSLLVSLILVILYDWICTYHDSITALFNLITLCSLTGLKGYSTYLHTYLLVVDKYLMAAACVVMYCSVSQ